MNKNKSGIPSILMELKKRGFTLSEQIIPSLDKKLSDYLLETVNVQLSSAANHALNDFLGVLEEYLSKFSVESQKICYVLLKTPVLQQADHSNLLLDQETFLNNFIHGLSLGLNGDDIGLTLQCSTVSCLTKRNPIKGPTFLNIRNELIALVDLSKRRLKNTSFCSLPKPFTFKINQNFDEKNSAVNQFLKRINGLTFPTAESAYALINVEIGKLITKQTGAHIYFIDEYFTNELAVSHIKNRRSPIYTIIFDEEVRSKLLSNRNSFIRSNENRVLSNNQPDFFWLNSSGKLKPLKILNRGSNLVFREYNSPLNEIELSANELNKYLMEGRFFCDRFLGYMMRCLVSGVRAIGGTSQQDSIEHYLEIIRRTDSEISFLNEKDKEVIFRDKATMLSGSALIEIDDELYKVLNDLNPDSDLSGLSSALLSNTVRSSIGEFACAAYLLNR
ncbi:hypothetical protein [Photorhabdus tasmaniensis]|uniref:Uncharacterized protein n=1 Tax=Photorhabdus tasmaniensis TaxID=1004159 RepID=A0ABX0GLZ5_9GAMM|nr:hypothetical protein [Photorhabdus tasmaniensis]NHB89165.1 hypothetical protein [Photorhabdus tasmaniensis]